MRDKEGISGNFPTNPYNKPPYWISVNIGTAYISDPLGHYFIIIFPLLLLCIMTGIISLNILNPPLDREPTSSPYEKLDKTSPKAARRNAWPRIISFPLNNLMNFFKKYTQRFKEKVTRPKKKNS